MLLSSIPLAAPLRLASRSAAALAASQCRQASPSRPALAAVVAAWSCSARISSSASSRRGSSSPAATGASVSAPSVSPAGRCTMPRVHAAPASAPGVSASCAAVIARSAAVQVSSASLAGPGQSLGLPGTRHTAPPTVPVVLA
jgi:hypothetical protein